MNSSCKRLHISEYLNENSAEILRTGIRTLIVFIGQMMKMLQPEKSGQYPSQRNTLTDNAQQTPNRLPGLDNLITRLIMSDFRRMYDENPKN